MRRFGLALALLASVALPRGAGAEQLIDPASGSAAEAVVIVPTTGHPSVAVTVAPNAAAGAYNPSGHTVGTSAAAAGLATPTVFLDIINDSTSASVAFCFGTGCTPIINGAGSITLPPGWHRSWEGSFVPTDPVNWIASAASTPVTVGVK